MEKIQNGKYVELIYEIFTVDEDGQESVYKFTNESPDSFVYGKEQGMIQGFMDRIADLTVGDVFDFTLQPAEAFGEIDPKNVMIFKKEMFLVDGKFDNERIQVGGMVPMRTQEGYIMQGIVQDITDDEVILDFNHPFAGETMRYVGSVKFVRDATDDELNPPAHSCSGGCSCGSGDSEGCSGCSGCGGGCN